jgi:hypothetical protein
VATRASSILPADPARRTADTSTTWWWLRRLHSLAAKGTRRIADHGNRACSRRSNQKNQDLRVDIAKV